MAIAVSSGVTRVRRVRAGFTLLELMIVVVIVGVLSLSIAPTVSETLADIRQRAATRETLHIARKARWEAVTYGSPRMVRFAGEDPQLGSVLSYEGMGVFCDRTDWAQAVARPVRAANRFFMSRMNPRSFGAEVTTGTTGRYVIRLRAMVNATAVSAVEVCYQPNGESFMRVPVAAGPAPLMLRQTDLITLTISRTLDGVVHGVTRRILIGPGEQPWVN